MTQGWGLEDRCWRIDVGGSVALILEYEDVLQRQRTEFGLSQGDVAGFSVNQFVVLAVAEKIAAISTMEYLENRARRGSRERLLEILNKAPDVEPEEFGRL